MLSLDWGSFWFWAWALFAFVLFSASVLAALVLPELYENGGKRIRRDIMPCGKKGKKGGGGRKK